MKLEVICVKEMMNQEQISRTIKRMAHEIIERNTDLKNLVFVGIKNKGVPIASKLSEHLHRFADAHIPVYTLDITPYRDDHKQSEIDIPNTGMELEGKNVIIIDDVLFTGRSVRAAMDAINDYGRPAKMQLAILIDRGHRELPIRADYIGKNLPTSYDEKVVVDINDKVYIDS